jgi:hypothetical protein
MYILNIVLLFSRENDKLWVGGGGGAVKLNYLIYKFVE